MAWYTGDDSDLVQRGGNSGGSNMIPTTSTSTAYTGGGGGGSGTVQASGGYTGGGSYWFDAAAQYAMYLGNIELQKYLEQGVNERYAKLMADNEANRSLQRSIATGYIDGNPTIDRQVAEWNRQNQLWNQGFQEKDLARQVQNDQWQRENDLWQQGFQEQNLGLNYLNSLARFRGPRDWLTYANTVRGASNTQLPAYMQALASGSTLSGFQDTRATTNGTNSFQGGQVLPVYTTDPNANQMAYANGQYVPPWMRNYGDAAKMNIGVLPGQAGYQEPWQRNYGNIGSGSGGGQQGGGMDYATAIARARSALAGMDGKWANASDQQIIDEIRKNNSLFVNDPIRNTLLGGGQQSSGDVRANGMSAQVLQSGLGGQQGSMRTTEYRGDPYMLEAKQAALRKFKENGGTIEQWLASNYQPSQEEYEAAKQRVNARRDKQYATIAGIQQSSGQVSAQPVGTPRYTNAPIDGQMWIQPVGGGFSSAQGDGYMRPQVMPSGTPRYTNLPNDGQMRIQPVGGGFGGAQGGQYNNAYTQVPSWVNGGAVGQYPASGATPMQHGAAGNGNPYAQQSNPLSNPYNPYTNQKAYSQFNISANKVRPDQWNNMTNSEQQMLFGQIEQAGGDPTDWEQTMRRSWLGGRARKQSQYGF